MTPFLLTAPGRSRTLRATLRSLAASDLPAPRVFTDPGGPPVRPAERPVRGFRALLTAAVAESTAPWLLCLEDDIALHPRLLHHLTHWLPFRQGRIRTFASLYNPTLPCAPGTRPARRWLRADPRFFYGAQALLIARPFALHALRAWHTVPGMQSQRLAAIATRDFPGASNLRPHALARAACRHEQLLGPAAAPRRGFCTGGVIRQAHTRSRIAQNNSSLPRALTVKRSPRPPPYHGRLTGKQTQHVRCRL